MMISSQMRLKGISKILVLGEIQRIGLVRCPNMDAVVEDKAEGIDSMDVLKLTYQEGKDYEEVDAIQTSLLGDQEKEASQDQHMIEMHITEK
jgi:hypothetical protein